MGYSPALILEKAGHRCQFRFLGCRGRATRVMLDCPEFLSGPVSYANTRAVCDLCGDRQERQRKRAAELFEGR